MRQVRSSSSKSQRGISLVLILGILGLIGLAAWLLTNRGEGGASSMSDAAENANVAAVLSVANKVKGAYSTAAMRGVSPERVTFDDNANTGLFHPEVGGLQESDVTLPFKAHPFGHGLGSDLQLTPLASIPAFPGAGSELSDVVYGFSGAKGFCEALVRHLYGPGVAVPPASLGDLKDKPTGCFNVAGSTYQAYVLIASR